MARRGTTKWWSVEQENWIARRFQGKRSPSSGAAEKDQGDVRTPTHLIECKFSGSPIKPAKSMSLKLVELEKIAEEAYSEDRIPMMAFRLCAPDSPLADLNGYVDVVVNLVKHVE